MTYSPKLGSTVSNTKMRTPDNISHFSGMCAVCTASCTGMCEIGLSALRGREATYPYQPDRNQFASEKDYPTDFSHLNINGRVFGAKGCKEDPYEATFPKASVETTIGKIHPIKLKMPIVLPAIAKLNWKDYFGGAALAGVLAVIGEDVVAKDDNVVIEDGKVIDSPLIKEMVEAFRLYYRGYGDIMLQGNFDDENLGVLDYAIQELGVESVELKFGQAAKGIQGMSIVKSLDKALAYKKMGYLVYPDPEAEEIAKLYKDGKGPHFEKIGKLPIWNEDFLVNRVRELRNLGAKRVCFKTGPFAPNDLAMILKIASKAGVDMVTFDGAGGGSGNSPVKMMNEWGIPTIIMESLLYKILQSMEAKGYDLPKVAVAGGIAMEDQVYKALALGAPYISMVGIGRAAMTASMVGKRIEELLSEGIVPKEFQMYGNTKAELFADIRKLKLYYENPETISGGAIGLYSYLDRIKVGIQQFMALNRKFTLEHISRQDVVPLTAAAKKVTGLKDYLELTEQCLKTL
ncbi:MAG TPA: FMN-binding glutamate synthase family protein [Thermoanaerobacterales bacterium]|nr:FMN-binding glutamate synthase family protein [Thermoanaerobacterales bacterium]